MLESLNRKRRGLLGWKLWMKSEQPRDEICPLCAQLGFTQSGGYFLDCDLDQSRQRIRLALSRESTCVICKQFSKMLEEMKEGGLLPMQAEKIDVFAHRFAQSDSARRTYRSPGFLLDITTSKDVPVVDRCFSSYQYHLYHLHSPGIPSVDRINFEPIKRPFSPTHMRYLLAFAVMQAHAMSRPGPIWRASRSSRCRAGGGVGILSPTVSRMQ